MKQELLSYLGGGGRQGVRENGSKSPFFKSKSSWKKMEKKGCISSRSLLSFLDFHHQKKGEGGEGDCQHH